MKTHYFPWGFTDEEEPEQAPCGTWLGGDSNLTSDWQRVDCVLCLKRKSRITKVYAAEEQAIVAQMGHMAAFMKAEQEPSHD